MDTSTQTMPDHSNLLSPERRAHARIPFDCPVRWNTGGVDRLGWSRDASFSGAGFTVRALNAPPVGAKINVIFELDPQREWLLDDQAVVERCDRREGDLYDIGVRLTSLQ